MCGRCCPVPSACLAVWCWGHSNTMWSPLWMAPQGHRSESVFRILCSHSSCGPLLERIQVYAERERLFHIGLLPMPNPGWDLASFLMALPCALRPSNVVMFGDPATGPRKLWNSAALSTASLPGMPM